MARLISKEPSRTFNEFLILPNEAKKEHKPENVVLKTPLVKFKKGQKPKLSLNIPLTSAIMQSVSTPSLAIPLAKEGGLSFIFGSQPIEEEVKMVKEVKSFKAGFVTSDTNLKPDNTIADAIRLREKTGHSTIAITDNGKANGLFLGMLTSKDFNPDKCDFSAPVKDFMTPFSNSFVFVEKKNGVKNISLEEANDKIWNNKINCLPIISEERGLLYLVFRKDYDEHKANPNELVDKNKRLLVGAGINTWDYEERVPALIEAGADILCVDSANGHREYQKETIQFIKNEFGNSVSVGGGNVVTTKGFDYLVNAGVDFVKVGIGGGSICITREQKGIGRGQATAVMEIAKHRDKLYKETGLYMPICSDGAISQDYHVGLACTMGADFVMIGSRFAGFDESPGQLKVVDSAYVKEYWGEGTKKAKNWMRYAFSPEDISEAEKRITVFEEGIESYVPYAGKLKDNVQVTIRKLKETMCDCGSLTIKEFQKKTWLTLVSPNAIKEGGAHDVIPKTKNF